MIHFSSILNLYSTYITVTVNVQVLLWGTSGKSRYVFYLCTYINENHCFNFFNVSLKEIPCLSMNSPCVLILKLIGNLSHSDSE